MSVNGIDLSGRRPLSNGTQQSSSDLESVSNSLRSILDRLIEPTQNVSNQPIINIATAKDVTWLQDFATPDEAHSIGQVVEEAFAIFDKRMRVNHPRFMGLIPSPTSPVAWLGDVVASAFNALGASKLQASGPVAVEKKLIDWLGDKVGFPDTRGGLFVSGGSMANLMAMVMARDRHLPSPDHHRGMVYVTSETHFSVVKALRLLGFGQDHVRRVAVDDDFRMDTKALAAALTADREAGFVPFAVVATCGTTNTGAVDPMREIAQMCEQHRVWMHVDGAYGASTVLSASHRHLVADLQYADSVSWDAHKWLFQTYSCGILLVKDRHNLLQSFLNSGDYLRDGVAHEDPDIPNYWDYSMELTRPAHRAMKLWFTLRVLGVERLGQMIDHGFTLAKAAEDSLREMNDWQITSSSERSLAILTFRYAPPAREEVELDRINSAISAELVSTNTAGILTTKVKGMVVLRICALSPGLSVEEIRRIIGEADHIARKLDGERRQTA